MRASEEFGGLVGELGQRLESLVGWLESLAGEHKFLTLQNTN